MEIVMGLVAGALAFLFCYCLLGGLYTINQNERAVVTNFGKAERIGNATNLDLPLAVSLRPEEKERYVYPQVA
jgi:regulator of protease activity HflC (stomatin/prohibitin superfamily)